MNEQIGDDHIHHQLRTTIVLNNGCENNDAYALHGESIPGGAEWKEFRPTGKLAGEYVWHNGML